MLRKTTKYQSVSLSFVPRSSKVNPTHNKQQYTNILTSSSSSSLFSLHPWTTSSHSSDLQILSLRTQVMQNDRNQQKRPSVVVRGRVDRSTSIDHSIVGTSALVGGKTICPMGVIIALGIPIIPLLLGANIYLLISIISATKTCNTTANPINWPMIGIIGLLGLATLTPCCFVCCCYYWSLGGKYAYKSNIELYHIERCIDSNCSWIDNESDNYTHLKMRLEENIHLGKPISGVSVAMIRKDSITLDKGNPSIKPPSRRIDEEENITSLLQFEKIGTDTRQKTAEIKNGTRVICVRSRLPSVTHQSSINDLCSPRNVDTIYTNEYDGIRPVSIVKKDSITLDTGNPSKKPSNHEIDEEENIISLSQFKNNGTHTRQKTAEIKNGTRVIRVRSKLPSTPHQSSTNGHCSPRIVNTIYMNEYDEMQPVSLVKKDSIKPPNRETDDEENVISLLQFENNGTHTRHKTAEIKNGTRVIRVRSKPPSITRQSPMNDSCPARIVDNIYINDYDEIQPVSDALNITQRNDSLSSQRSIPLNETELTRRSPKLNSANNNGEILSVPMRIERIPKKIKPNKTYIEPISEITKDKNKYRPRVKHVPRQNLL